MSREYKANEHKKFHAQVMIQEQVTYDPAQNSYGDVKPTAQPADRSRQVLELTLAADSLEKLQAKIIAHVELAE